MWKLPGKESCAAGYGVCLGVARRGWRWILGIEVVVVVVVAAVVGISTLRITLSRLGCRGLQARPSRPLPLCQR